ncbi:DUF5916 domain-containing protein [uncultured Microscilla sp.]|uniref:DUF5916 domain-containing protein n=1 Tax=uncultured Microscilla sp. TaxID=432653 RepID=UPI00263991F6|nr:DUF5916 domain-containing protein [uncultured Microscilla sp.]
MKKQLSNYQRLCLLVCWLFACTLTSYAKPNPTRNQQTYKVNIVKTAAKIKIDGNINEEAWKSTNAARNFLRKWPTDKGQAEAQTEVRLLYDDHFLYISAVCFIDKKPVIQTLRRDVGHWNSDGFALLMDPMNQHSNGFLFGVNAGGAQMEGLTVGGQNSMEWDAKWYSRVKLHHDRWVVEMAIPFKSLRYSETIDKWGINFIRNDMQRNAYSTWAHVPIPYDGTDLGYTGALRWDSPPKKVKGNVVLIPYIIGGMSEDFEETSGLERRGNAGLDAKIAITSNLNLDLTINPDFSQVDVDQQVTNLSRFSLFFPERRNFFLENRDLFADFGTGRTQPFFSRRVGLKDGTPVPILAGARLSGNITKSMRVGILDVQTQGNHEADSLGQNQFVATVQQRVWGRSSINAILVNRQAFDGTQMLGNDFNRVAGMEFRYLSNNGDLRGALRGFKSFTPDQLDRSLSYGGFGEYRNRKFNIGVAYEQQQENFIAELGFTPRLQNYDVINDRTVNIGFDRWAVWGSYTIFSKGGIINNHRFNHWHVLYNHDVTGQFQERNMGFNYRLNFTNSSNLNLSARYNEVQLPFALDLIGGDEYLPATFYAFSWGRAEYNSDNRQPFSVSTFVQYGTFYNGTRLSYGGGINFRAQPWGNFRVNVSQNYVELPGDYGTANLTLVSPTVEISFSNTMFWTTFLQYNTQADNFNINSRFQWRFRPMSDLFIVYTDNYFAEAFKVKNRALVIKLSYWLNL